MSEPCHVKGSPWGPIEMEPKMPTDHQPVPMKLELYLIPFLTRGVSNKVVCVIEIVQDQNWPKILRKQSFTTKHLLNSIILIMYVIEMSWQLWATFVDSLALDCTSKGCSLWQCHDRYKIFIRTTNQQIHINIMVIQKVLELNLQFLTNANGWNYNLGHLIHEWIQERIELYSFYLAECECLER